MDVAALHARVEQVVDGAETGGEDVLAGQQHGCIEEGVLEAGVAVEELLAQESGVVHVSEEAHVKGVVRQVGEYDGLHVGDGGGDGGGGG